MLLYTFAAVTMTAMGIAAWGVRAGVLVSVGILLLSLFFLCNMVLSYRTCGSSFDSDFLQIVRGCYGKQLLFVKYDKIQYVEIKQSFLAKRFHMQKALIHLLASAGNKDHAIPYYKEEKAEILKEKL